MSTTTSYQLPDLRVRYEHEAAKKAFISFIVKVVTVTIFTSIVLGGALSYALVATTRTPVPNQSFWIYGVVIGVAAINIYFLIHGIKGLFEARMSIVETQFIDGHLLHPQATSSMNSA